MIDHNETLNAFKRMSKEDPNGFSNDILALIDYKCETAKAEAIKEFADIIKQQIDYAIKSNEKAIAERVKKHGANRYEDDICTMCDGKIAAMRGLESYIDLLVNEKAGADNG